ncbi:MAG: hypothetical protein ACK5ZM_01455 [bacterium]
MKTPLFLAVLLTASSLVAQDKAALKRITGLFQTVEENYEAWPHQSYRADGLEGGYAFENHVWKSEDEPPLYRVESLSFDDHGQGKKQFFFHGSELLFVLDRSEMTPMQENAATSVVEKRLYFAGGGLISVLEKTGKVAVGKPTDTTALKNKEIPVDKVEGAGELYGNLDQEAQAIIAKAYQITADDAPAGPAAASGPATSGDGWRLIRGSQSRDGQIVLAWGVKGKSTPEGEPAEDGTLSYDDPEDENLANYAVNLSTGAILGQVVGSHGSDKPNWGHYTNEVAWSAADTYFAQVCSGKWSTYNANLYQVSPDGAGISEAVDLLEPAKKAAFDHLANGDFFKKFDKDAFAFTLHDVNIAQRGAATMVVVEVSGQIPKSEQDGAYFDLTVTFKILSDENGGTPKIQWSGTEQHYD